MSKKKKIKIIISIILTLSILFITIFLLNRKFYKNDKINFIVEDKNGEVVLKIESSNDSNIYYTLDGSIPNKGSNLYTGEIIITRDTSPNTLTEKENANKIYGKEILYDESLPKAAVVRASAISSLGNKSDVYTKTIFPDIDLNEYFQGVTVVSLVTDPKNLLDYESGIMVKGKLYDDWLKENNRVISKDEELVGSEFVTGNFMEHGRKWERDGNLEIFDGSNNPVVDELIGFRIKGNISRMYNQKSLNIYFREEYKNEYLNYPLWENSFDDNGEVINKYKSITLRNGGNDAENLKFKDDWLQNLVSNRNVDIQSSKLSILFINGEYWGVYNLQEKYSEDYYAYHHNLDRDNIIVIKEDELDAGIEEDYKEFEKLMSYASKDLSNDKVYNEFLNLIDLQSMLDYYAIETYINNADWGIDNSGINKNVLLWRTRNKENNKYGDTKWRWSLYDLEFSSSTYNLNTTSAEFCAIKNATSKHPLFASAMKNENFKNAFYNTYYDLQKQNFNMDLVKNSLTEQFLLWQPFMKDHYKRFGNNDTNRFISRNSTIKYFEKKLYSNPC